MRYVAGSSLADTVLCAKESCLKTIYLYQKQQKKNEKMVQNYHRENRGRNFGAKVSQLHTHPHTGGRRTDMHKTLNLSSRGGGCEDIRTNCARRISFLEQFSVPFILLSVRSTLFTLLHSTKIPFYREKAPTHIFTKYSRPTLSYLPTCCCCCWK